MDEMDVGAWRISEARHKTMALISSARSLDKRSGGGVGGLERADQAVQLREGKCEMGEMENEDGAWL